LRNIISAREDLANNMRITFNGACREVTGSCALIETSKTKFLVDCGLFQGQEFSTQDNFSSFGFNPKEIDFVLLTHAHVDHCGRIPKLNKEGFKGKIYCTLPTRDLTEIILLDSANIISKEALKNNSQPLFREEDVVGAMNNFSPINYHEKKRVSSDVEVRMSDAGHILGSSIFEVFVQENGKEKKIVFSGDLGNNPTPIIHDMEFIDEADFVIIESTYGGRFHEPAEWRKKGLHQAILESIGRKGVLMIPAFSLERTQEIIYELNDLAESEQISKAPIFLDSPLAIKAVDIYRKYVSFFDEEAQRKINSGDDLFNFSGLKYAKDVEESRAINQISPPKIILAGAGMCNGGRITYHLKRYLPGSKNHLLMVGYQAENTLGRKLLDGNKKVEIDGEFISVRAKVSALGSYSSHADQPKLLYWLGRIRGKKPQRVFINHGEEKAMLMLADGIKQKFNINSEIAEKNKIYEI